MYYNTTKVNLFRCGRKFHRRHFHILAGLNMYWINQGFEAHLQVEYSGIRENPRIGKELHISPLMAFQDILRSLRWLKQKSRAND